LVGLEFFLKLFVFPEYGFRWINENPAGQPIDQQLVVCLNSLESTGDMNDGGYPEIRICVYLRLQQEGHY